MIVVAAHHEALLSEKYYTYAHSLTKHWIPTKAYFPINSSVKRRKIHFFLVVLMRYRLFLLLKLGLFDGNKL